MRYAIVSDIHANWQAWSAVRDDIRRRGVDAIVCLGDIVGYGPSPARVFADLVAHCDNIVLGNHDAAAAGGLDLSLFNERARRSALWTAAQFDRATLDRLGAAPLVIEGEDVLFVHAETPAPDEFGYVETEADARACFEATAARFIFIGHTHCPQVFALAPDGTISMTTDPRTVARPGVRYLVNVGSVGDPGDGTNRASYGLFDPESGEIALKKVAFDVAGFRAELEQVPELSLPWFLRQHTGEAVRPVSDLAVGAAKVAGTRIRVPASRAKIRIKSSALTTHADGRRRAAAMVPAARRTGVVAGVVAIGVATVGAIAGIHYWRNREAPAPRPVANVWTAPPEAPLLASSARSSPPLPAFRAVASREERENGMTNLAAMAVDGNPDTRWCAGDALTGHWLQIDFGRELRLGAVNIAWELPEFVYGYTIEGSDNGRRWNLLTQGSGTRADRIVLTAECAQVRISVTKLPAPKWASISEVTFFDAGGSAIRTAPPVIEVPVAVPAVVAAARPAPSSSPAPGAEPYTSLDALGRIEEAKAYRLVYDLDLAKLAASFTYDADHSAGVPSYDRVAYLIELRKSGSAAKFLWVSMDAFTAEATQLGVPTAASGIKFQRPVTNLTVASDVPGILTGAGLGPGHLEFWSSNYGTKNENRVPGASDADYDFGDVPQGPPGGYGSMQVHNIAAKQTLFAINNWRKGHGGADIGIGNSGGSSKNARTLDWTFTGNGGTYTAKRLRIFVRPAP